MEQKKSCIRLGIYVSCSLYRTFSTDNSLFVESCMSGKAKFWIYVIQVFRSESTLIKVEQLVVQHYFVGIFLLVFPLYVPLSFSLQKAETYFVQQRKCCARRECESTSNIHSTTCDATMLHDKLQLK